MMTSRKSQLGMSLIEVLASILIFAIGILGMVALQARSTQVSLDAEDRSRAAVLANEAISSMWTAGTQTLTGTPLATWQALVTDNSLAGHGLPGSAGTITLDTTGAPTSPNITTINITWKEPGHAVVSQFSTSVVID